MVDYWFYTKDTTWNAETEYSLVFQAGAPQNSYMSPNWTASLGNDDQGFWGLSAMLAAETNFQNPDSSEPQWLALAQAVFNTQAARWGTDYCNGGLRWQIPLSNNGYDYKNSIANGIFFNIAARLARYTANETYAEWAIKAYDWTQNVGYIDELWNIYDGAHVEHNCTDINKAQFSYTAAVFIQGAGFMYNYVSSFPFFRPLPLVLSLPNRAEARKYKIADQSWKHKRPMDLPSGPSASLGSPTGPLRSSSRTASWWRRHANSRLTSSVRPTCCLSKATCTAGWLRQP